MTDSTLQNLNETSSDDMVNIQIEESLVRETLMSIDSANFNEDLLTIVTFGFILIFVLLTGVFGPPDTIPHYDTVEISNETAIFEKKLSYFDINSLHNHVALSLTLTPKNSSYVGPMKLRLHYNVHCHKGKSIVQSLSENFKEYTTYVLPDTDKTVKIHLYNNTIINFDTIELELIFDHADVDYKSFTVEFITGSVDHTMFQIYFRIAFAVLTFVLLCLLMYSLRKLEVKLWHLEQKMTIPLLVLLILYNDPLYIFHCYTPSIVIVILDRIVYAVFHAYLSFFILVLFDSLRYKNRKTDTCFFIPKVVLCLTMMIMYAAHGIYDELHMYDDATGRDPTESALSFTELALYLVFVVYATVSIIISSIKVDVTERYKFNIYLSSGIIAVAIMAIAQVLFSFKFVYGTSLSFVLKFAAENVFTMLMAYFHWPYEVLQDQQVESIQETQDAPKEFFVNDA